MSTRSFAETGGGKSDVRQDLARLLARRRTADLAFAGLVALGIILVLIETRGLSPFADDWEFIVHRRGISLGVLLTPHGPHLVLVPILIYKVWLHLFGASSYLPFRLLAGFDVALLATTLGWFARRYWGPWWGLAPVLLIVTLGPAGESVLWSFQCCYAIASSAGLAALVICATRTDLRGDLLVTGLLLLSLASVSSGIGFVAGVALLLLIRRRPLRQWWCVLTPAVLYAAWYLKYGRPASESDLSLWHAAVPYAATSLSATLESFLGLSQLSGGSLLDTSFGVPMAVVVVGGGCYALWRGWRPPALFWALVATAAVLWSAGAVSNTAEYYRPAADPRYLEANAMILLPALVIALPRPRLLRAGVVAAVAVLAIIALTNAQQYSVARDAMSTSDVDSRAELGALLMMRGVAQPQFTPAFPGDPGVLVWVTEQDFLSAYHTFGLQADSPAQIAATPESTRELVDKDLGTEELVLTTATAAPRLQDKAPNVLSGTVRRSNGCITVSGPAAVLQTPPGRYVVEVKPNGSASLTMARFASSFSFALGAVPSATRAVVSVAADHAPQTRWQMMVTGTGTRICQASK